MRRKIIILTISFVFSVFIWLYINLSQNYVIDMSIPLSVKLSSRQALGNELPDNIDITIKGKGWDLITMMLSKSAVYNLDLTNYKRDAKISTVQGLRNYLEIPSTITVLNIYPDTLEIRFDNLTSKIIKVKNNVEVIPKEGYVLIGNPVINPDSVFISGATSILSKIKFISTEYINLNDVNSNVSKTVKLLDTLPNQIKIEPKQVTVSFKIELAAEKKYEDVDVLVKGLPEDREVIIIPPKITLTFRGGVDQLSKTPGESLLVKIDFKSIEKDSTGFVTPDIETPDNLNLINYEPQQFRYIIKKRD